MRLNLHGTSAWDPSIIAQYHDKESDSLSLATKPGVITYV